MTARVQDEARAARRAKRAQLNNRRSYTRVHSDRSPGVAIMPEAVTSPPGLATLKDPAMAKYADEAIDTKVYKCSRLVTVQRDRMAGLGPEDKVPTEGLLKLRKAWHDQQPKRLQPKLDAWLTELLERQLAAETDDDEMIKLAGYIADMVRFSARVGDRLDEPGLNKLWKVSDFPKWPKSIVISMADCVDVIQFMTKAKEMFENSGMPLVQYISFIQQLLTQTDATDVSKAALRKIREQPELTSDFTNAEDYNILIINALRKSPVDYLYEKWINDMHNRSVNVEVRSENLRRTLYEIQRRYADIPDRDAMHLQLLKVDRYQTLCYYGLQADTDKIIKGQSKVDGSGGHLSEIPEPTFYELTEDLIRIATIEQGNRKRAAIRQAELNAAARHQPPRGGRNNHTDNNSGGGGGSGGGGSGGGGFGKGNGRDKGGPPAQVTDQANGVKRKWNKVRACPHCGEMPCEHEFRKCPKLLAQKKPKLDNNQSAEKAHNDYHIAKLAITEGNKVEELPDKA